MALQLQKFATAEVAALALAQAVSEDLRQATASGRSRVLLLVSGGRSPLPFFHALSRQSLPWERVDVSLVDERSVAPEHPDANAGLIKSHLLQAAAGAARFLPLMANQQEQRDPLSWAQHSARLANANAELTTPAAIVLGLGTDGHTASLFADAPQWQEASTTQERYTALTPPQAPHARVSLSLHALLSQGTCYVWSNGPEKLEVIKQAQALAAAIEEGLVDAIALHGAGPFVQLVAHPDVKLRVFHSEL